MKPSRFRSAMSPPVVIMLGAGLLLVLAFTKLAEEILEGETQRFDQAVSLALHLVDSAALDLIMGVFTVIGEVWALSVISGLVAVWCVARKRRRLAGIFTAVVGTAAALNVILKLSFGRARPTLFSEITTPESFSFPSGHAMGATAVFFMAAIVLGQLHPKRRRTFHVAASAIVLLIGLSRVFLGVHWATDVLGGFAAGSVIVLSGALAVRWAQRREEA